MTHPAWKHPPRKQRQPWYDRPGVVMSIFALITLAGVWAHWGAV